LLGGDDYAGGKEAVAFDPEECRKEAVQEGGVLG